MLIYENRTGLKVYSDYGCIPHEDFTFIAASPDGIDELGNVIEIKCVYSRKSDCQKKIIMIKCNYKWKYLS